MKPTTDRMARILPSLLLTVAIGEGEAVTNCDHLPIQSVGPSEYGFAEVGVRIQDVVAQRGQMRGIEHDG